MKQLPLILATLLAVTMAAGAQVRIDEEAFGKPLGGWKKKSKSAAEYPLSGSTYRTFKPEVSPTPAGGLFVSIRIDHVRGWLSSDDHATLEITVDAKGGIESAQSNIAIQGRSISSDVIVGTGAAAQQVVDMDRAVQVGTDLVANLTAKLLREKIVESGRVSFPAAIRHNYNLLFQSIRYDPPPSATVVEPSPTPLVMEPTPAPPMVQPTHTPPVSPPAPATPKVEQAVKPEPDKEKPADDSGRTTPLSIKPYGTPGVVKPAGP
jgi:hypothetical protein